MNNTDIRDLSDQLGSIPSATTTQHADARAYVVRHAPDLLAMIFGSGK